VKDPLDVIEFPEDRPAEPTSMLALTGRRQVTDDEQSEIWMSFHPVCEGLGRGVRTDDQDVPEIEAPLASFGEEDP
jgi:hypothetical protein